MTLNDSMYSSEKMDWATPQWLFDRLNNEFGFTFDVAASLENTKCKAFLNKQLDGLSRPWPTIGVVWMNPPYGRDIKNWVKKHLMNL